MPKTPKNSLIPSKFNLYIKVGNKYVRYYKFELTNSGFYIYDYSERGDHFSYHNDGNCFYHHLGKRSIKKIRKPLNEYTGIETLRCLNVFMFNSQMLKLKNYSIDNKNDVLIDRTIPFCLEINLSNKKVSLPTLTERINSKRFQRKLGNLWLIIEVYENSKKNYVSEMRYSPNKWVVGQNFFSWIDNKWQ